MTDTSQRLRRLVADELGECHDGDVDDRLCELHDVERAAAADDVARDVRVLSALGSDTRYRIARLLVAADEELCVCELEPLLDVSESAVSHALSTLANAGLVERRKDGKWRFYRATARTDRLLDALDGGDAPEATNE